MHQPKKPKQAKITPEELSPQVSNSNKICEDYSGDEEGIQHKMTSTPSPHFTPVVIHSSSDDESVQAGLLKMMMTVNF